MNWFHVLAMSSIWALCMARSSRLLPALAATGSSVLEPALHGRITTHVHIECEPVGPEWHAWELPRDHRVGADDRRLREGAIQPPAATRANDTLAEPLRRTSHRLSFAK